MNSNLSVPAKASGHRRHAKAKSDLAVRHAKPVIAPVMAHPAKELRERDAKDHRPVKDSDLLVVLVRPKDVAREDLVDLADLEQEVLLIQRDLSSMSWSSMRIKMV